MKTIARLPGLTVLALFFYIAAFLLVCFIVFSFFHGFPLTFLEGTPFRFKGCRKIFEWLAVSLGLALFFDPHRSRRLEEGGGRIKRWTQSSLSLWVLAVVYFLIFLWQQVTKYLALEINFIPFLFYDYMLWYFNQASFCYTGFLHGFYHVNLILLSLYPVWAMIQSPWVLHVAQPFLAAVSAVPLYFWARETTKDSLTAWVAAFAFLNFRFLQNVLAVNFVVEIFYPLWIFCAVYFAVKKKEAFYYLSVVLGLLVKEDSAIYFGGLGFFYLFKRGDRRRGLVTMGISVLYALFILKVFLPWSGSTILKGDLGNYKALGAGPVELIVNVVKNPWLFVRELFIPPEKLETLFKLTSKLLFLPLFSPWFLMVLAAIYPLFFRSVAGEQFVELGLYYSAPVLPFLFLALVDGWRRVMTGPFFRGPAARWGIPVLLVLLNGFNLRPVHFDGDDLKTITLARGLPAHSVVVTQGHLLPYLGYRYWNFYMAEHFGRNPRTKDAFENPDYYLFDFEANPYPLEKSRLQDQVTELKQDARYRLRYEDHRRVLLERVG